MSHRGNHQAAVVVCAAWLAMTAGRARGDATEAPRFNRDVRPILSDKCFPCHGPDAAARQADLRLDHETAAVAADGSRPIVPGNLATSELYRRIAGGDVEQRMPPAASGKTLSAAEVATIGRWIEAGARWEEHWAFLVPARAPLPLLRQAAWPGNAIDAFVLARLETEGLAPSPEADRATLVRRVTLDLTGLPPTPAEVDAFLTDDGPDAYEKLVDRLLASPRYGERMAAPWLDAARYADTNGYQDDGPRQMWRWRDWVIEAFNRNLPFDQFTIQQIAGDLLPGAGLDERIATGFNRNHRTNAEGGIIAEEYAVEYVVDRVDTTATVWLGLTLGCARCHDHKFDPLTQREYYQLFAFFNNVPEKGRGIKVGNSPPVMKAPTREQQAQLASFEARRAAAEAAWTAVQPRRAAAQASWADTFRPEGRIDWGPETALVAHFPFDANAANAVPGAPAAETQGPVGFDAGAMASAAAFDGSARVVAGDVARLGFFDPFTITAWIRPRALSGTIVARMAEQADADGYQLALSEGKLQVNLVKRWLDDALRVETQAPLQLDRWRHVAATYDGTRDAESVKIFIDGVEQKLCVLLDELNQSFANDGPLRLGAGGRAGPYQGLLDDVRIYQRRLEATEIELLAAPESIDEILRIAPSERSPRQSAKLAAYYLEAQAEPALREVRDRARAIEAEKLEFEKSFPDLMVMVEMPQPRETRVLERGEYDKPRDVVTPGVPASLHALPPGRADRLRFARWLVDPANPLTARVAVNRFWQMLFGSGIVKTVDDFGAQGEAPSHPELLDWLAVEFMESGWDIKRLLKLIVTSATYRQGTRLSPELLERDPHNRLLARGPRLRLPAEAVRDTALAASGLLVERVGGPSVRPYSPPGLWKELTGTGEFEQDRGEGLYRRSLYTYWKRTIAPPSMITFDASAREACTVRETRTNTPLQALALLNEVTFVEAARALAARVLRESGTSPDERLALAFRLAVGRPPSDDELTILGGSLVRSLRQFRAQPQDAERLLAVGEMRHAAIDPLELAAYASVANLILNLDEVVTKE